MRLTLPEIQLNVWLPSYVCVNCAGPVMYGLAVAGMMGSGFVISLAECFVFSSLIVAVDPVAVRQLLSFIICFETLGVR